MAGDDDAPAGFTMRGYGALEAYLIVTVERARRLVKQPNQSGRRDETSERQSSSLARRQPAAGPVGNGIDRECTQRRLENGLYPARIETPERHPERQCFA